MTSVNVDLGITVENTYSIAGKQVKFDSPQDIEPYTKEIKSRSKVAKIDLSGNTLGIEASALLAEAILQHRDTLVEVDFSDLYTGRLNTEIPQSLQHLLPALLQCTKLKVVNLSDNAFGLQTIDPIEEYLAKAVTIEHLILSNNGMGPYAGARIGQSLFKLSLAKKKQSQKSLETFICGRNRLENGSINYLSIGLRNHEDLEVVRLYQNGIRPIGVRKLIRHGLSFNKKLRVLDLQDNTLTTQASVALAHSLNNWNKLEELNLNDCLLKPHGSLELTKALADGPVRESISSLKLQYNELEAPSLQYLFQAMEHKLTNLDILELNGNRFEEEHDIIEKINDLFETRNKGSLDELDDLEEIDSEEEDEEDEEDEDEQEKQADADEDSEAAELQQLEKELEGKIQDSDKTVDEIATELSEAHLS